MARYQAGSKLSRTDGASLPEDPPEGLVSDAEIRFYGVIRSDLMRVSESRRCDLQQVILCVKRLARLERLGAEVEGLDSLMIGEKLHPLVGEVRLLETACQNSLAALGLNPRSRNAQRGVTRDLNQVVESDNPEIQMLLDLMPK